MEDKRKKSFAGRLTLSMLMWLFVIAIGLAYVIIHFEGKATREFYSEIFHSKMLTNYEYTRRVISDVYVAVTNNIYYLEHTLDNPDTHKATMERIVRSGTRIRSCGISFIEDYYPEKGHRFCPFAWRNAKQPDIVYAENMGDADLDYLNAEWFLSVIQSDSARWSEPFFDGYDETTTLSAYMVPIHDQSGRTIAVLGADISLDWLTKKLQETDSTINKSGMLMANQFGLKTSSYIINHDGSFITHADEKRIIKDNFFDEIESCDGSDVEKLISDIKNGELREVGNQEIFLIDGVESYLFYTPVKYTKWVMITVVPCHAIEVLGWLNGTVLFVIVFLAMLAIVVIGYYYMKNGIAPIKPLTQSVNEMADGKFDAPMPELKHKDEIFQLRDAIEKVQYTLSDYSDKMKRTLIWLFALSLTFVSCGSDDDEADNPVVIDTTIPKKPKSINPERLLDSYIAQYVAINDAKLCWTITDEEAYKELKSNNDNLSFGFVWSTNQDDLVPVENHFAINTQTTAFDDKLTATTSLFVLRPSTVYYYTVYVNLNNKLYVAPVKSFTTLNESYFKGTAPSGAQPVNLGLPSGTLWANMNVGAEKVEEAGLFFAWGETDGYTIDCSDDHLFGWAYYEWCKGSRSSQTKYCTNSSYGQVDNKTVLDLSDDAAYINWGKDWRMPTDEEMSELKEYTTIEWVTIEGVDGYRFISKTTGYSIFFPAMGCRVSESNYENGIDSYHWSSTVDSNNPYAARYLRFYKDKDIMASMFRYYGMNVRAVHR